MQYSGHYMAFKGQVPNRWNYDLLQFPSLIGWAARKNFVKLDHFPKDLRGKNKIKNPLTGIIVREIPQN